MKDAQTSGRDDHMMHPIYKREKIVKADYPGFCSYGPVVWEDPYKWEGVILGPLGSPYQDGLFFLSIDLPNEYPSKPPIITFLTKIFHPNIDEDGKIYVNILEEDQWKPIYTIESLLISICSLLADPDPADPDKTSCILYNYDREEFNRIAREWTKLYAMGECEYEISTTILCNN